MLIIYIYSVNSSFLETIQKNPTSSIISICNWTFVTCFTSCVKISVATVPKCSNVRLVPTEKGKRRQNKPSGIKCTPAINMSVHKRVCSFLCLKALPISEGGFYPLLVQILVQSLVFRPWWCSDQPRCRQSCLLVLPENLLHSPSQLVFLFKHFLILLIINLMKIHIL